MRVKRSVDSTAPNNWRLSLSCSGFENAEVEVTADDVVDNPSEKSFVTSTAGEDRQEDWGHLEVVASAAARPSDCAIIKKSPIIE